MKYLNARLHRANAEHHIVRPKQGQTIFRLVSILLKNERSSIIFGTLFAIGNSWGTYTLLKLVPILSILFLVGSVCPMLRLKMTLIVSTLGEEGRI